MSVAPPFPTRNPRVFAATSPFVVTTRANRAHLDPAPFGVDTRWFIDPHVMDNGPFFALLQHLDGLTFGPEGMPMDKWVFYNCAELPGFIYGFAVEADDLDAHERALMEVPEGYTGPVPLSMYIAIPMHEPGAWFGHNLASLNPTFPRRQLHALGTLTKAFALRAFRAERFVGATQWRSKALFIHLKFGPLAMLTAYTPAHSTHETLTYGFTVTDEVLRAAAGDPAVALTYPPPDRYLDADDAAEMRSLQRELEAGARFELVGPPAREGARIVHPIRRVPAPAP